jgi:hypothetical protein
MFNVVLLLSENETAGRRRRQTLPARYTAILQDGFVEDNRTLQRTTSAVIRYRSFDRERL